MKESNFQFNKPILKSIEYRICDEFNQEQEVTLHRHLCQNVIRIEGKNEAIVELIIEIGCDEKSINAPFCLKMTIGAGFRWNEELEEFKIEKLLSINAPSLLLSYARPIIANITSNSIVEYDIPFINFVE